MGNGWNGDVSWRWETAREEVDGERGVQPCARGRGWKAVQVSKCDRSPRYDNYMILLALRAREMEVAEQSTKRAERDQIGNDATERDGIKEKTWKEREEKWEREEIKRGEKRKKAEMSTRHDESTAKVHEERDGRKNRAWRTRLGRVGPPDVVNAI